VISATAKVGALERSYRRNTASANQALERLTTGKRINRPSDDPAGFIAAEQIRGEITRLEGELKSIGSRRASARLDQSALTNIQDQLVALKGTLVGAADGLLTPEQRSAYETEIAGALEAIERIGQQRAGLSIPSRSNVDQTAAAIAQLKTRDPAELSAAVDSQSDSVSFSRAALAAYEKYELDVQQHLAEDSIVIHAEALSQIEDADFAQEATNLAVSQILAEGALTAMTITRQLNSEHIAALMEGVEEVVE
jgi:flagellin